jgi:ABC-type Zn2+ transport system substrate-binding protein/surface adhesin
MGVKELTELYLTVGFASTICIIAIYMTFKQVNYWYENRKKNDSSSFKKDQTITSAFLDGEKVKTDLIISDKREASELLTREREQLNKRLTDCEHDLKECNLYIRTELTTLINKNIETMQQVNISIAQINDNIILTRKEMADLKDKIGKIKEITKHEDDKKPYEKNFKEDHNII